MIPKKSGTDQLLDIFWSIHDPTQLDRQGPDIGSNYRSVIFYHDAEQGKTARKSKEQVEVSGRFGFGKVVTQILPATEFYRAEEYISGILKNTAAGAATSDTFFDGQDPNPQCLLPIRNMWVVCKSPISCNLSLRSSGS